MKANRMSVFALGVMALSCSTDFSTRNSGGPAQLESNPQDQIEIAWSNGAWQFLWGSNGTALPVEASLALYAERRGQRILIKTPQDVVRLEGFRISSPEEALLFVRLFTKGNTYYRFIEPQAVELAQSAPTVQRTGLAYTIVRQLLYFREHPDFSFDLSDQVVFPLYQVVETVYPNGRYSCKRGGLIRWVQERDLELVEIK